jgi:hypothetical protein
MKVGSKKLLVVCAFSAMLPTAAMAVDGVVLLDQNKALMGSVTPGDAPGFPITISQPGSYKLDGNLTVPSGGTAIEITVPNVSIDLNGFSIVGTPAQTPTSFGIRYTGPLPAKTITVRNGHINGITIPIDLGSVTDFGNIVGFVNGAEALLQDLYLSPGINLAATINLGSNSRVTNVSAVNYTFAIACPSVITNSVVRNVATANGTCVVAHTAVTF